MEYHSLGIIKKDTFATGEYIHNPPGYSQLRDYDVPRGSILLDVLARSIRRQPTGCALGLASSGPRQNMKKDTPPRHVVIIGGGYNPGGLFIGTKTNLSLNVQR